jgi:hypothetical protein
MSCCQSVNGQPIIPSANMPFACSDVTTNPNKCAPMGVNPMTVSEAGVVPAPIYPATAYDPENPPASLLPPPSDYAMGLYLQYAVPNLPIQP